MSSPSSSDVLLWAKTLRHTAAHSNARGEKAKNKEEKNGQILYKTQTPLPFSPSSSSSSPRGSHKTPLTRIFKGREAAERREGGDRRKSAEKRNRRPQHAQAPLSAQARPQPQHAQARPLQPSSAQTRTQPLPAQAKDQRQTQTTRTQPQPAQERQARTRTRPQPAQDIDQRRTHTRTQSQPDIDQRQAQTRTRPQPAQAKDQRQTQITCTQPLPAQDIDQRQTHTRAAPQPATERQAETRTRPQSAQDKDQPQPAKARSQPQPAQARHQPHSRPPLPDYHPNTAPGYAENNPRRSQPPTLAQPQPQPQAQHAQLASRGPQQSLGKPPPRSAPPRSSPQRLDKLPPSMMAGASSQPIKVREQHAATLSASAAADTSAAGPPLLQVSRLRPFAHSVPRPSQHPMTSDAESAPRNGRAPRDQKGLSSPLSRLEDSTRRILQELQQEEHGPGPAGSPPSPRAALDAEPGASYDDADYKDVRSSTAQLDAIMQQEALARQQQLVLRNCQQLEDVVRALLDREEAIPQDGQARALRSMQAQLEAVKDAVVTFQQPAQWSPHRLHHLHQHMSRQANSSDVLFAQIEALALENAQLREAGRQKNSQIEGLVAHVYDLRRQLDRFHSSSSQEGPYFTRTGSVTSVEVVAELRAEVEMHRAEVEAKGALLVRHVELERRLLEANRQLTAGLEAAEARAETAEAQSRLATGTTNKGRDADWSQTEVAATEKLRHLQRELSQASAALAKEREALQSAQRAAHQAEARAAEAEASALLHQREAIQERDRRLAAEAESHLRQAQVSSDTRHLSHAEQALRSFRGRVVELEEERDALAARLAELSSRSSSQKVSPAQGPVSDGAERGALQRLHTTAQDLEEQLGFLQRQRRQEVASLQSRTLQLESELDCASKYNAELAAALEENALEMSLIKENRAGSAQKETLLLEQLREQLEAEKLHGARRLAEATEREQAANAALEELQGQRDNLHELLLEKTELVERVMKKSGEASHSDSGLWSSLGAAGNLQQDRAVFLQERIEELELAAQGNDRRLTAALHDVQNDLKAQVDVNQALVVENEQLAEQRHRLLDEVTRALLGGSISGEARRVLASLADVAVGLQDEVETEARKSGDRQQRVAQKDLKREKRKVKRLLLRLGTILRRERSTRRRLHRMEDVVASFGSSLSSNTKLQEECAQQLQRATDLLAEEEFGRDDRTQHGAVSSATLARRTSGVSASDGTPIAAGAGHRAPLRAGSPSRDVHKPDSDERIVVSSPIQVETPPRNGQRSAPPPLPLPSPLPSASPPPSPVAPSPFSDGLFNAFSNALPPGAQQHGSVSQVNESLHTALTRDLEGLTREELELQISSMADTVRDSDLADDVRDMMVRKIVKMRARLQELGVSTTLRQAATAEQIYESPAWGDDVQTI